MAKKKQTEQTVFTGVHLRTGSIHNGDQRYIKLEFTASWTDDLRRERGWKDVADIFGEVDILDGLAITQATLVPEAPVTKSGEWEAFRETFSAVSVDGLKVVPLKDKSGEVTGRELRFTMKCAELAVIGRIARYVNKLGRAPGNLTVTHANEEEQAKMGDATATEEQRQAVLGKD